MPHKLNSAIAVIGIDIGKNSFHVVGHDKRGAIVLRQKWSRGQVDARLANLPPCLIGMEAWVGAHHLSRKLQMQLDLQALHRVRERLVSQRTGIINQIRAFLLELRIAVRQGLRFLRAELAVILAARSDVLSPRILRLVEDLARAQRGTGPADSDLRGVARHLELARRAEAGVPGHDERAARVANRILVGSVPNRSRRRLCCDCA
jgi:transposase